MFKAYRPAFLPALAPNKSSWTRTATLGHDAVACVHSACMGSILRNASPHAEYIDDRQWMRRAYRFSASPSLKTEILMFFPASAEVSSESGFPPSVLQIVSTGHMTAAHGPYPL